MTPRIPWPLPELTTPRLRLRAPTLDDTAALFTMYGNAEVMRYSGRAPHAHVDEIREKLTSDIEAMQRGESVRWVMMPLGTPEVIGTLGLFHWSKNDRRAEIGYLLHPSHWGRGLMKEILPSVVRFGFEVMRLHRVDAQVDPENVASLRVLENLGFRREGLLRESTFSNGRYSDTVVLGLLEQDWR